VPAHSAGVDGVWGTDDDVLPRLKDGSECVDAGNNEAVITRDADGDGQETPGSCDIPEHGDRNSCEAAAGAWGPNCADPDVLCIFEAASTDLLGFDRFVDIAAAPDNGYAGSPWLPIVDMGAYEKQ
jgi:hypothetical protein